MNTNILTKENIILNSNPVDKWEAIESCGEILVKNGYVTPEYIDDMKERERTVSVYVGNHVAIPHGLVTSEDKILTSGISFVQVPEGVSFNDEKVYVFIGIAGKRGEHNEILSKIALACLELENVEILRTTQNKDKIIEILLGSDK
ncbi:PTS system, mannitol-specific IIA component [Enterococcus sp. DIV2402]|uniref:Mannitol-specific phosphotransferase enzyme IIA component n=1 Tax=Candidatus Enterococcus lowellii TaxID=2230877 RepID=A0ABZ2SR07_9ENTE|nr:PTS sugar transporter subunit IIA [Enterococcus sp. DIV2402]